MQLKLSSNDLALALTGRDVGELRSDELQAEVAKLSPGERNIVEAWIKYREVAIQGKAAETSTALAAFQDVVLESVRAGDAPGYGTETGPLEELRRSPEYQRLTTTLKNASDLLDFFSDIDRYGAPRGKDSWIDGKLDWSDIQRIASGVGRPGAPAELVEFCKSLTRSEFEAINPGRTGKAFTAQDLMRKKETLEGALSRMERGSGNHAPDPLAELENDPDYVELGEDIETAEQLMNFLALIDEYARVDIGSWDGSINWDDIQRIKDGKREHAPEALKEFCRNLTREQFERFAPSGAFNGAQLQDRIDELKAQRKAMKNEATNNNNNNNVNNNNNSSSHVNNNNSSSNSSNNANNNNNNTSTDEFLASNPVSLKMGNPSGGDPLGRASERLHNAIGGLEDQLDAITDQMSKETNPEKLRLLEKRFGEVERMMARISKMYERIMTLMQNLDKLFHDVTMNAIRNMK